MNRTRTTLLAGWVGLAGATACSSAKPPDVSPNCEVDEDCAEGTVCNPFTARCVSGDQLPPRGHLSFDIRERSAGQVLFRAEVRGCDFEVQPSDTGFRALSVSRSLVSQSLSLWALNTDVPVDPNAPTADETITTTLELTQDGRFGLPPNPIARSVRQAFREDETPMRVTVPWPRYDIRDEHRPPSFVVVEARPESLGPLPADGEPPDTVEPAPLYQMLALPDTFVPLGNDGVTPEPCTQDVDCCTPRGDCDPEPNFCIVETGECTLIGSTPFSATFAYDSRCNRAVVGSVVRIDLETGELGEPVEGASIALRYADVDDRVWPRLGVPGLVSPEECTDDSTCGAGRFCDPQRGRCVLALAGRDAGSTTTDDSGQFSAQVYTYCEDAALVEGSIERRYTVTTTPAGAMPSVTFDARVSFSELPSAAGNITAPLCVPDWGESVSVQVPLQGVPRQLATTATGLTYQCCDVGCLPAAEMDAEAGPPAPMGACRGRTAAGATPTVRFEAPFTIDFVTYLQKWGECAPLDLTDDDDTPFSVGTLRADANCPADGDACVAEGLALGTDDEPRTYSVRIQSPTGSVLGSEDREVSLSPSSLPMTAITLPQRVLVRGVVDVGDGVCGERDDPTDCASRGAVVIAERLAMPGETTATVPGPYLHQVTTYYDPGQARDGAFVLPLDPGVYVMTALPAPGEDGGPADFQLLDLRGVEEEAGPLRFVLEEGILVTMNLASFDRTFVVPLDTGSFIDNPLTHPEEGRFVDLNRVGECLIPASEGSQGCKIRQLVPAGSNVSASQVGLVRFTARRSGAAECGTGA